MRFRQKKLIISIMVLFLALQVFSKEMNLYRTYTGDAEFATLTLEEQYTSYINSFAHRPFVLEQPMYWARLMVKQYGRSILPYLNDSILSFSFDIRKKNKLFVCIDYVIYALEEENLLTPLELQLYQMIFAHQAAFYRPNRHIQNSRILSYTPFRKPFLVLPHYSVLREI